MHGFTMENLARDVQIQFLLDCWKDFYMPTVRQRDIFQRLYQNMLDGRCDALFMLDQGNKRDLMDGKDFKTTNFYHPATDTAVYVRSEFGAWGTHDNYHWYCYVETDDRELGAQALIVRGLDETDSENEEEGQLTTLMDIKVDTGIPPNTSYGNAIALNDKRVATVRQLTPEGLKASWTRRAFPSIQRQIRKLKRCRTCKKRVQANPRCETCIMTL